MKRIALLAAALALMGMVTVTETASAGGKPTVRNCNGYTLVSANYVRHPSGYRWGAVQLCRNGDDFFAMFINYEVPATIEPDPPSPQGPMWAFRFGNAVLYRVHNGEPARKWDCNSPGGNGIVKETEWWCMTPKIDFRTGDAFRAQGAIDWWENGEWVLKASGWTAWCDTTRCV